MVMKEITATNDSSRESYHPPNPGPDYSIQSNKDFPSRTVDPSFQEDSHCYHFAPMSAQPTAASIMNPPDLFSRSAGEPQTNLFGQMKNLDQTLSNDFSKNPEQKQLVLQSAVNLQYCMLQDKNLNAHSGIYSEVLQMNQSFASLFKDIHNGDRMMVQMLEAEKEAIFNLTQSQFGGGRPEIDDGGYPSEPAAPEPADGAGGYNPATDTPTTGVGSPRRPPIPSQPPAVPPTEAPPPTTSRPADSPQPPATQPDAQPPATRPDAQPPAATHPTETTPSTDRPTTPTNDQTPTGSFHVENGKIYDPTGNEFIPNGIAVTARDAGPKLEGIIDSQLQGANVLRVGLGADQTGWFHQGHYDNPDLDKFIQDETRNGKVVILDMHSTDANNQNNISRGAERERLKQFYESMATKYKDNPYVWFQTPNEPMGDAREQVSEQLESYSAVRKTGNKNPVIFESEGGYSVKPWLENKEALAGLKNVLFDIHSYGGSSREKIASTIKNIEETRKLKTSDGNAAVFVGECGNSIDGQVEDSNQHEHMQFLENLGIGKVFWKVDLGGSSNLEADSVIDNKGNFSRYGEEVKDYINSRRR